MDIPRQHTVLITGAGFSKPYGYPTGAELIHLIAKRVWNSNPQFSMAIRDSSASSIEAFLNDHSQYMKDGKIAIAKELMDIESKLVKLCYSLTGLSLDSDLDIIDFLLNEISVDDFPYYSIITFNYDRHFQWKLFKKIRLKSKTDQEALQKMSTLKIISVHGSMPGVVAVDGEDFIPYGSAVHAVDSKISAYAVKTFNTTGEDGLNTQSEIKEIIQKAQRVFFLGFGFEDRNMMKLGFEPYNQSKSVYSLSDKTIAATALGLSPLRINDLSSKYSFLKNNLFNVNCKHLFKDFFSLTNPMLDLYQSRSEFKSELSR